MPECSVCRQARVIEDLLSYKGYLFDPRCLEELVYKRMGPEAVTRVLEEIWDSLEAQCLVFSIGA